jgi:hypothetical protein
MKNIILTIVAALALNFTALAATVGTTTGADFTTSSWINNSTTSIGNWYLVQNPGSSFSIGDSTEGGRPSIGTSAYKLTPGNYVGAQGGYANAYFALTSALSLGQTLSFDLNFLWNNGTKGFELQTADGVASLFKVEQNWGIPVNATGGSLGGAGAQVFSDGYQKALSLEAEAVSGGLNFRIKEAGSSSFIINNTFLTSSVLSQIRFYAGNIDPAEDGNKANHGIYVNNISIIPEPSSSLLMGLGLAGLAVLRLRRVRKNG